MEKTTAGQALPGDIVTTFDGTYNHATVKCINDDGTIQLFRPYVHYGSNIQACYIGTEYYFVWPNTPLTIIKRYKQT